MTPAPSRRFSTPGLDELLKTTRMPPLDPSMPPAEVSPTPNVRGASSGSAGSAGSEKSSSWDLKPGRWIKALPSTYRIPRKPRARFTEWARDEKAVASMLGIASGAVGLALVIGALVYGAIGLSRGALSSVAPSVAIASVAGRVALSLLAIGSGHTMIRLAERLLKK